MSVDLAIGSDISLVAFSGWDSSGSRATATLGNLQIFRFFLLLFQSIDGESNICVATYVIKPVRAYKCLYIFYKNNNLQSRLIDTS